MNTARYRAVLFDVDGTLYRQDRLRAAMAAELAASAWRGLAPLRIVREYRRAHESLRALGAAAEPHADVQIARAAAGAGVTPPVVAATVAEWMERRPLKYLRWCRRPGLPQALDALARLGVKCGVLSDYAPGAKLAALGLDGRFDLALCTTDREVNALKPHPRGFEVACARWGLAARDVLYVGDRPDVDGRGAHAAGLPCAIIGAHTADAGDRTWLPLTGFDKLEELCLS
jgi:HAD superfamily hydrolase (TIGR01549 family)